MKKQDLKVGHVVVFRDGDKGCVVERNNDLVIEQQDGTIVSLKTLTDQMCSKHSVFSVMEVLDGKVSIWKREGKLPTTEDEIIQSFEGIDIKLE
ncbi:MAG: hypothetical protein ACRDD8_05855 [Bacteroidales bacterium]